MAATVSTENYLDALDRIIAEVIAPAAAEVDAQGAYPQGSTRILSQTTRFDHCNFTVISSAPHRPVARFRDLPFSMSYDDPKLKSLMDMEGLKSWREGRTEGYAPLEAAVSMFGYSER